MYVNQTLGKFGEDKACKYLEKNDYIISERNFRCKQGEIDIIAKDLSKNELVFVEVKTRLSFNFGRPAQSVNYIKQKHILNWEKNKAILDYLEKEENQELYKRLDFENILNLKMKDLYNEYLASDEFQKSIEELRDEGNYFEYIKNYISVAKNFNKYYDVEA